MHTLFPLRASKIKSETGPQRPWISPHGMALMHPMLISKYFNGLFEDQWYETTESSDGPYYLHMKGIRLAGIIFFLSITMEISVSSAM